MAIEFARVTIHSRSRGHSAVAGAAYRAGTTLLDERTGEIHNFEKRHDVAYTSIMLPDNVDQKFSNREYLWNAVEAAEKRKDAQVAKDVILALPKELEIGKHIDLARQFAYDHFVKHGLIADIAIHDHGDGNPHAHLYITTRRAIGDRLDKYKARDLNPSFANWKGGNGFVTEESYWNKQWRDFQDAYFEKHDLSFRVDANHLVPQRHEGLIRGKESHYLKEDNALRRQASIELAEHHPDVILNELAVTKGVFTQRHIESIVEKNTESDAQKNTSLSGIKQHPDLIYLGPGEDGRDRYTTKNHYLLESELSERANLLDSVVSPAASHALLNKTIAEYHLNNQQADALHHIASGQHIAAVVGRAGTGKSYMMNAARALFEEQGLRLYGMSVSAVAASGLQEESGITSHTIAYYKKLIQNDAWDLDSNSVVVMDEAGMTNLNDMAAIVRHVEQAKARLILVGDHDQLQAIGPGAPFRALVEQVGFAEMDHIMRQKDPLDCQATLALAKGDIATAIDHYDKKGQVFLSKTHGEAQFKLISDWCSHLSTTPLNKQLILAHTNEHAASLNMQARSALLTTGAVHSEAISYQTDHGKKSFATGDRIIFLKNNKELDVKNGQFATVVAHDENSITVCRDSDQATIEFNTNDYRHFDYGYAATVYKSQGVTLDNTFVYASGGMWDRFLTYVALSRHRYFTGIYASQEDYPSIDKLKQTLSRDTVKDSVLDYPFAFAQRRGFESEGIVGRFVNHASHIRDVIKDKWLFLSNYRAYFEQKDINRIQTETVKRRESARIVAEFVDLYRAQGKEWSNITKALKADDLKKEALYKDSKYHLLINESHYKNALAAKIVQNIDLYGRAIKLNNITKEAVQIAANRYYKECRVKHFISAYKQGNQTQMMRHSEAIAEDIKGHYSSITTYAGVESIKSRDIISAIKINARNSMYYCQLQQAFTDESKHRIKAAYEYTVLKDKVRSRWAMIYQYDAKDNLSKSQLIQYHKDQYLLDEMAATIFERASEYQHEIAVFNLDKDALKSAYDRHLYRSTVQEYVSELNKHSRESLANDIMSDKNHYRFVYEAEVDWKQLTSDQNNFLERIKRESLPKEERPYMDHVLAYQKARINSGKLWSEVFKLKDQGIKANKEQLKLAFEANAQRNALAYQMLREPKRYAPYFEGMNIQRKDLEKHMLGHLKKLQKERHANKAKNTKQKLQARAYTGPAFDKQKGQWKYEAVSHALDKMGEQFYQHVLGFEGKKEGVHHIRYGQGHALTYALSGEKAGSWHSFSSGEGGGPLQLLMSQQHGWGLSYEQAFEEGARIAGLSPDLVSTYQAPKIKRAKAQHQPKDDVSKKIASARYYYHSAQAINGTLGERYLREHRRITGAIEYVKFHPKIRDSHTDKKTGKTVVTYHPGIVVPAYNEKGELTGVQTIILDPKTANKVNEQSVGAVKRSRGIIKGSVVPIQKGTSHQIILAEGVETALSIKNAARDANIYVTLGNVKNAQSLAWLTEKHKTNKMYFAADFDPHTQNANLKVINDIAREFKNEHGIETYVSQPMMDSIHNKCDFNDLLGKRGEIAVKVQLKSWKKVDVKEREQIVDANDIKQRVADIINTNEKIHKIISDGTKKIAEINKEQEKLREGTVDKAIDDYKSLLLASRESPSPGRQKAFEAFVVDTYNDKSLFVKISKDKPSIAKVIKSRALAILDKDKDLERD